MFSRELTMTREEFALKFKNHFDEMRDVLQCSEERIQSNIDYEFNQFKQHYNRLEKAYDRAFDYCESRGTYVDETILETFYNNTEV